MAKDLEGNSVAEVGEQEKPTKCETYSGAAFVCLFVVLVLWAMYLPFGVYYGNPDLPVWEKNDYRICVNDGDVKTAELVRFDAGDEVPSDDCSLRLHPASTLLTNWQILEYWAWATYNAHHQGESEVADNTHRIRDFQQYDDMIELLRQSSLHRVRLACDSQPGVRRLRCLREKDGQVPLDWSWAEE